MIHVEEAQKIILDSTKLRATKNANINDCLGNTLAEDIHASLNQPPFNRVAMDGIAINFDTTLGSLKDYKIEGVQAAGSAQLKLENDKNCIEVMTGAILPEGTNTVIPYEQVEINDGVATIITETMTLFQNIHSMGVDYKKGDLLLKKNTKITAPIKAVIASQGNAEVKVFQTPKIAIISTGSELVELGNDIKEYQIYKSNTYAIDHELRANNYTDNDMIHIPDTPEDTEKILKDCLEKYDLLVLTGGVSKGKFDYVPDTLNKLGVEKHFHKIKQKPGKPMWYGTFNEKQIFALPGNPVSCLICLNRYVLPAISKSYSNELKTEYATLTADVNFKREFSLFKAVEVEMNEKGNLLATPVQSNGSGDFYSLSFSDGYVELPADKQVFKAGETFKYFKWS